MKYKKEELQSFGLMLSAVIFFIAWVLQVKKGYNTVSLIWIGLILFIISVTASGLLKYVYHYWMKGVSAIGAVMNVVLMTVLYFTGVGLTAIFVKLFKTDPLDRKIEKDRESYWGDRVKVEYDIDNMRKQF